MSSTIFKKKFGDIVSSADVDIIYKKIESYLRIVKKTACDMVPKAIMLYIIKRLQDYINNQLLMVLLDLPDDDFVSISKIVI